MTQKKFVVRPEEVDTVMTDWTTAKIMCDPRTTMLKGMSAVVLCFEPGQGHFKHNHTEAEQIIYVISGQGKHITEFPEGTSSTENISEGSLIYIPQGVYHSTYNTGWEPMKVIAVFTPPGPEASLREKGDSGGVGTAHHRVLSPGEVPIRGK